jgi:hypothetical protein
MSNLIISDLSVVGADLFEDSESFMQELNSNDIEGISGGSMMMVSSPAPQPTPPVVSSVLPQPTPPVVSSVLPQPTPPVVSSVYTTPPANNPPIVSSALPSRPTTPGVNYSHRRRHHSRHSWFH